MGRSRYLMSVTTFLVIYAAFSHFDDAKSWAQEQAACRDNFETVMQNARAEWPMSGPFEIPQEWARYFMAAYNAEVEPSNRVAADRVVVFPMDPSESATWWYFGFANDCLTFYAELGESKGYHLIEQGFAMLNPEQQLE